MTTKPTEMFGKVKERKLVFVRARPEETDPGDPAATPDPIPPTYAGYFTFDINISFEVDEIILLSWFAGQSLGGEVADLFFIDSSLLKELNYDGIMTGMMEQEHDTPRYIFNMKGTRVQGTHTFTIRTAAGDMAFDRSCTIAMALEFVQYYR